MKQTLKLIGGIAILALIVLSTLFILDSSETSEQEITYIYPSSGEYTSYEIQHIVKGYEGAEYESTEYGLSDQQKQEMFESYREQENAIAGYQEAREIAEEDAKQSFVESEEDRIEAYCDENGFESCYNIRYTCETEYECHLVTIECEDYDYDPQKEITWGKKYGCDEWKVTVGEEDFDIRVVDESYWEGYGW